MEMILQTIAHLYNLGELLVKPVPITGGRSHKIWKIITASGEFAVKQLLIDSDTQQLANLRNIEHLTAYLAQQNFPALVALRHQQEPICIINKNCYVVYPWLTGIYHAPHELAESQVQLMGQLLRQLHSIQLTDIRLLPASYELITAETWQDLALTAIQHDLCYAGNLRQQLSKLIDLSAYGQQAFKRLLPKLVVSHGDLDPYNVLWLNPQVFYIIDWELANLAHPLVDFAATLLYWSLINTNQLDWHRAQAFIEGYGFLDCDKEQLADAFYIVLGQWLKWFEFNVKRAIAFDTEEPMRIISIHESQKTFDTVLYLLPLIVELAEKVFAGCR